MPAGPDEGGDPYLETVQSERPGLPIYHDGDENETPDVVIVQNEILSYPIWQQAMAQLNLTSWVFIDTTQLVYRCWRKFRSSNRNHWKIELMVHGTDATGKTRVYKLYPYATAIYNFDPADIQYYMFTPKY